MRIERIADIVIQMEQDAHNYEIAYLLSPAIAEGEVLMIVGRITTLIEEQKGAIKHAEEPRKRKLAYAINKERNAYFGWTTFRLDPAHIAALEKKLKIENRLMRYLIVQEETRLKAPVFRTPMQKPAANKMPQEKHEQQPEEKLDLEALDKKLEEILGK